MESHVIITSLPLSREDRAVLIDAANSAFEDALERIEPQNRELTRCLWDAGHYVDHHLLKEGMLPIARDEAEYLVDVFLFHHVIDLAVEADQLTDKPPVLN